VKNTQNGRYLALSDTIIIPADAYFYDDIGETIVMEVIDLRRIYKSRIVFISA
jgi:hypothetical protein